MNQSHQCITISKSAVPELNDSFPLEPVAPELAVDIDFAELVVVPSPLRTKTSPPEDDYSSVCSAKAAVAARTTTNTKRH